MPRTTIDIDPVVLRELKRRQRREGKSLGRLVSELLTPILGRQEDGPGPELRWHTRAMGARVDLDDPEALRMALDEAT